MTPRPETVLAMTSISRRSLIRSSVVLGAAGAAGAAAPLASSAQATIPALVRRRTPQISHGVQSGDVSNRHATIWARADRPAQLLVEVARHESFRDARMLPGPVVTEASDLTGRLTVRGLPPGTDLHYRVRAADLDDPSRTGAPVAGRLRTAPGPGDDVSFVWGGDIAGQGWGVNPDVGGFPMADTLLGLKPDFFLCSGDTVYADGPVVRRVDLPDGRVWRNLVTPEKSAVAQTLDEFRGQYRYNLMADNWREFLARTPQVNQWDDHEVTNNWYPGEILDDPRYSVRNVDVLAARARRAFHDYLPIEPTRQDRTGRIYRRIPYGPLIDVFVLDMRSYKDPNTANLERRRDGGVLGREQTAWLKRQLKRSTATWKVIAADLPIGLLVPDGEAWEGIANGRRGRPLGRELDLHDVLAFLQQEGIRNHVWLTADVHYTAAHHYSPERAAIADFDPFWEFVSGPLNAGGFGPNELDATFGPRVAFQQGPPRQNSSPLEAGQYVGEVTVDARSQAMTVRLRGRGGDVLWQTTLEPRTR